MQVRPSPAYCMACGTALEEHDLEGRPRRICPACDLVHWENPVPAAAVIVRRGRQVLLCRRAIPPREGCWGLPAGYQEVDETAESTAVRETREETGLIVRLTGLIDVLSTTDDPRKPSLLVVYEGEEMGGDLCPGTDCSEVGFFDLGELPRELAFHNDRVVLERLRTGAARPW